MIELQAECEHSGSIELHTSFQKLIDLAHFTVQEMAAMLRQKLITVGGAFLVAQERIMKLELNSLEAESSLNQPAAMLLSFSK